MPPAWANNLRPASFRGAPFFVDTHEREGGRRVVVHEYPKRDQPYPEDLGRSSRQFSLDAFVLGDEYMARRDALMEAMETGGPGTLVHPYLGTKQVQPLPYRVRESRSEGGWARFSLTFVEAGPEPAVAAAPDLAQAARVSAADALPAFRASFLGRYSAAGQDWLAQAALGDAGLLLDYARSIAGVILRPQSLLPVGQVMAWVNGIRSTVANLANTPAAMADLLGRVVAAFGLAGLAGSTSSGAVASTVDRSVAMANLELSRYGLAPGQEGASLLGVSLASIPATTGTRARQSANQAAMVDLVQRLAVAQAVTVAMDVPLASYDEAQALLAATSERLEALTLTAADSGDDAAYATLRQLSAATRAALAQRGASLARLGWYEAPPWPAPVLAIAYDLYEDLGREAEIVNRNAIRHPNFPPGGGRLEVLVV